MKKLVMLIFSVLFVSHVYAQDVDTVQVQSAATTIDSLTLRLDMLQHRYDFMTCENELYKIMMDFKGLTQDINIKTNEVLVDVYHSRYDRTLYNTLCDYSDGCSTLYNSFQEKYESVKKLVLVKAISSSFDDSEIDLIESYLKAIDNSAAMVETAIKYYDYTVQNYKKKR